MSIASARMRSATAASSMPDVDPGAGALPDACGLRACRRRLWNRAQLELRRVVMGEHALQEVPHDLIFAKAPRNVAEPQAARGVRAFGQRAPDTDGRAWRSAHSRCARRARRG